VACPTEGTCCRYSHHPVNNCDRRSASPPLQVRDDWKLVPCRPSQVMPIGSGSFASEPAINRMESTLSHGSSGAPSVLMYNPSSRRWSTRWLGRLTALARPIGASPVRLCLPPAFLCEWLTQFHISAAQIGAWQVLETNLLVPGCHDWRGKTTKSAMMALRRGCLLYQPMCD